jgi:hypothetical protein
MTSEFWLTLGASALLVVAGVARGLVFFRSQKWWYPLAIGARTGSAIVLAVVLVLSAIDRGYWSPFDLQQAAFSLALAMLCMHLMLSWRCGVDGAGPVADLVALLLVLAGLLLIRPGAPQLTCFQRRAPFYIQWALSLLGAGGVIAAGSAGLQLLLRAGSIRRGWGFRGPSEADLHAFLGHATVWALIALGTGLTVGVWWAWRAMGSLASGDPREVWMASTWLVAGTSLLSWQLKRRSGQLPAGLVVMAAAVAIFGLLAVVDLRSLFAI